MNNINSYIFPVQTKTYRRNNGIDNGEKRQLRLGRGNESEP